MNRLPGSRKWACAAGAITFRIVAVRIGMTLPVMEPDVDLGVLRTWSKAIDTGPFSSLCWGERVAFGNPDSTTLLGAVAAWTERVRLVTTVVVPQLHDPTMLAKALATGDVLSGGRLSVGVGIGGRAEDYASAGADTATQTIAGLIERVDTMRSIWAGHKLVDSVLPVGPAPVQPGGPPLLIGSIGPRTIRSAARWADGLCGVTLDLDLARQAELFDVARDAWTRAHRATPHLSTSFWYAIGDSAPARTQIHRHLRHYMNWLPADLVDAMAPTTGWSGSEDELVEVLTGFAEIGTDEVVLIPTSSDIGQLDAAARVAARFA